MNRVEVSSCWRSGIHFWAFLDYWSDVLVFIGCILFSGGVDDQCGKLVFENKINHWTDGLFRLRWIYCLCGVIVPACLRKCRNFPPFIHTLNLNYNHELN